MSASLWPVRLTTTSVPRWPPTGFMPRTVGLIAKAGVATAVNASKAEKIGFMVRPGVEVIGAW